ncbi:MAG: hypothetical protein GF409_03370 [Candidatus Omnitrophica bacterium]|nr:hypothetical protein [Candidatus Omnitrophota bacterium]
MKYRTVIELICEASDKEEATNIAGEYLRGDMDFGVEMGCKTASLWSHRMKKCAVYTTMTFLVFTALLFRVTPIDGNEKIRNTAGPGLRSTYTIMPALKTKHRSDFKKEWDQKKQEAVLEFLKK